MADCVSVLMTSDISLHDKLTTLSTPTPPPSSYNVLHSSSFSYYVFIGSVRILLQPCTIATEK